MTRSGSRGGWGMHPYPESRNSGYLDGHGLRRVSTDVPSLSDVSSRHHIRPTFCTECHKDRSGTDPVLLYTADLRRLMESNHLRPHLYADDTQIYAVCIRQAPQSCNSRCLRASTRWRCGCGPIDYSSTRPRPRSSGARRVDDRIKYLRSH